MPGPGRTFALIWCLHGALVGLMTLLLPVTAAAIADPAWAEAMADLGAGAYVGPARQITVLLASWWPWLALIAVGSLGSGLLCLRRPDRARWPLHATALLHVVLATLATIAARPLMAALGSSLAEDLLGLALLGLAAAASSWHVERMRRRPAPAP